jgi:hypothetical protein
VCFDGIYRDKPVLLVATVKEFWITTFLVGEEDLELLSKKSKMCEGE